MSTTPPNKSTGSSFDESLEEKAVTSADRSTAGPPNIRHSVFFSITVVGACAFLSPGIWNAMNNLGAGGAQEPWLVNAANSATFGLMVLTCLLASTIVNLIGYKWSVVVGTLGYAPYAAGLYLNKTTGASGLVLAGAVLCGLSAGLFWGVEGSLVLGYPEPEKRGRYVAYWLGWRNGGGLLGGIINLALNAKSNKVGSVGSSTYIVFIVLQALAPFVALLLANPQHIVRPNGTRPQMESRAGFKEEMRQMWELMRRREVLLLAPVSFYAQFSASYLGTFLSLHFSVRSRALASLLVPICSVIASYLLGAYMDNRKIARHTRYRVSFIICLTALLGCWTGLTVLQTRYSKHAVKGLDWASGEPFRAPFALYVLTYTFYYLLQSQLYVLFAALAREPTELVRLSSFLRGLESAGSACAFGVNSRKTLPQTVPLGINFALCALGGIVGWFSVREVGVTINNTFKSDEVEE